MFVQVAYHKRERDVPCPGHIKEGQVRVRVRVRVRPGHIKEGQVSSDGEVLVPLDELHQTELVKLEVVYCEDDVREFQTKYQQDFLRFTFR